MNSRSYIRFDRRTLCAFCIRYFTSISSPSSLDVLYDFEKIGLCTGYTIGGEVVTEFPGDLADLEGVAPACPSR